MIQDARHDPVRQLQGAASGACIDNGSRTIAHGLHKSPQLGCQRLFRPRGDRFEIELRLGSRLADTNAQRILARIIERDVLVLLKETKLANAFGGNAAGRQIGDRAGFELDTSMRDIHFVGNHGNA